LPPSSAGASFSTGSLPKTERVRRFLADDLRAGLSDSEAGQRYCALASPELYNVLTVEFGWTAEQHRRWLTDLLETELLRPSEPAAGRC
jgi:hypothetical protein